MSFCSAEQFKNVTSLFKSYRVGKGNTLYGFIIVFNFVAS